jgi:hypothetical protein
MATDYTRSRCRFRGLSHIGPAGILFRDDAERERFVERLGERVASYRIRLYAYCLMLTHVHLYLETPGANLGRFMHSLNTAFTVYSNLRRNRHGPLVERYKARPVEGDRYHRPLTCCVPPRRHWGCSVVRCSGGDGTRTCAAWPPGCCAAMPA